MRRARTTRLTTPDGALGVTVHEHRAAQDGPHVVVFGGIHGNEVGGIVAAGALAAEPWSLRAGRLSIVPIAHEAAQGADLRVSPIDGLNLAREFPGDPTGSPTQALAALLDTRLIAEADLVIDLHTSSPAADMPLFVGCLDDGSAAADRATELATAFGLPMIWTHPRLGPGRTLTAAHDRGIPALYVESPAGGVLDDAAVAAYIAGVRAVIGRFGLLEESEGTPLDGPRHSPLWVHGDGDTDSFTAVTHGGYFIRAGRLLDPVEEGHVVGRVVDGAHRTLETIRARTSGYVTTLQRTATVAAGQAVVGVTAARPARLGLRSDAWQTTHHTQEGP